MNNCMHMSKMILHIRTLDILLWLNWRGQNEEEPYKARITNGEEIPIIWVRHAKGPQGQVIAGLLRCGHKLGRYIGSVRLDGCQGWCLVPRKLVEGGATFWGCTRNAREGAGLWEFILFHNCASGWFCMFSPKILVPWLTRQRHVFESLLMRLWTWEDKDGESSSWDRGHPQVVALWSGHSSV